MEPNLGVMMSAEPHENTSGINSEGKNYFKLPFEAYYSEHLAVTILDFQSDIDVKKFEDIKVVHREQGGAWGVTFRCSSNTGPELYCCIKNLHDEVAPEWLEFLDEENIEFNSGDILPVSVKKGEIVFMELSDAHEDENSKDYLDIGSMENCCTKTFMAYEIADSEPDYLVLDADNSRIKVSLEGFLLDDSDIETDVRIFNPDELAEEDYENYTRLDMWEAKVDWVDSTLEKEFPNQKGKLKLAFETE
jgi:hypothetical protein